jgi:hypothetical protein
LDSIFRGTVAEFLSAGDVTPQHANNHSKLNQVDAPSQAVAKDYRFIGR